MPAPDPYATAQGFLAAVIDVWGGKALPKDRWVAEGTKAAWDGEQVTVTVGALRPGMPNQPVTQVRPPRAFPISVELTVEIVRNRGAGLTRQGGRQSALPTVVQDQSAGAAAGADLTALLTALRTIRESGAFVSHPTKIAINGVQPVGPDGDLVGVQGTVVVLLGHL